MACHEPADKRVDRSQITLDSAVVLGIAAPSTACSAARSRVVAGYSARVAAAIVVISGVRT